MEILDTFYSLGYIGCHIVIFAPEIPNNKEFFNAITNCVRMVRKHLQLKTKTCNFMYKIE